MIFSIRNIYNPNVSALRPGTSKYVLAVTYPMPLTFKQRCKAAWEVFRGRAVPFRWPKTGELEDVLNSDY